MTTHAPTRPAPRAAPPFSRWRYAGFALSLAVILLTLGALAWTGLPLGLDFSGGALVEASSPVPWEAGALRAALAAQGLAEAGVQLADGGRTALVRAADASEATLGAIRAALGEGAEIRRQDAVGPRVSAELFRDGALASFGAVAAIAVYVWLRSEAKFGAAAFITTLRDVIAMVGFYAVTRLSFDLTSVAALLAIAGCSINDTVVVFDRIRETLARMSPDAALPDVIDRAISDTLRRNLMTSGSTLAASVALMVFGGPVLFGFAAAVSFGIVLGTFSSIFVAAPLLLHLPGRLPGRAPAEPQPFADAP